MKIRIVSDLHSEFEPFHFEPAGEDLFIFAGDIGICWTGMHLANRTARALDIPVLYVSGNHEYYRNDHLELNHHTWEDLPKRLSDEADHTSVVEKGRTTYLEKQCVVYQGVRFIGGTLWTDMAYFGESPLAEMAVRQSMADYHCIWSKFNHPLTIDMVKERHRETLAFFKQKLAEPFDGPTVVISHHTPSQLSVPAEFKHEMLTAGYSSRLEEFILDTKPTLWVHGHTHTRFDYILGDTRVICNPRGYVPYESTGYDPNFIVEVKNGTKTEPTDETTNQDN